MLTGVHRPRETPLLEDGDFVTRIWAVRLRLIWLDLTDERYNMNNKTDNVRLVVQQLLGNVEKVHM